MLGDDVTVSSVLGQAMAQKTDGVPLFVEEVVVIDAAGWSAQIAERFMIEPWRAVSMSLRETLTARLDRCGVAKRVAQIAAVIGRSARDDLLAEVVSDSPEELANSLAVLLDARILIREEAAGGRHAVFCHALICDAAYDSLLRAARQAVRLRVAHALAKVDPLGVSRQPELYALHLSEGGAGKDAAPHWLDAARRSLSCSALTEATRLLRRGIAGLEPYRTKQNVSQLLVEFYTLLGPATIALKGAASAKRRVFMGRLLRCPKKPRSIRRIFRFTGAGGA